MARSYSYGYYSTSTNKYNNVGYGSGAKYGIDYPAPTPTSLAIQSAELVSGTYTISWVDPTFTWNISASDSDVITYQLQINFGANDFSNPDIDLDGFSAEDQTYLLPTESQLSREGLHYARIRSYDGLNYSSWSDVYEFNLFVSSPYPPTIDTVTSPADDFWQLITGTKETSLHVFIRNNDGDWSEASYPNGISGVIWQYNMPLVSGDNYIEAISSVVGSTSGIVSDIVSATINLIVATTEAFNVWNYFDELGLLLGLERNYGENNSDYKDRLSDVYQNPASATYAGLKYGIARELGLTYSDITIEKLDDLANPNYSGNLLNEDNNAINTPLETYVSEVYSRNPIFWGNIIADEGYWDSVDEEGIGYSYLPHIWDPDASGLYEKWQSPGIGDNDDLWVKEQAREVWNPGISGFSWYLDIHSGYFYSSYPSGVFNL